MNHIPPAILRAISKRRKTHRRATWPVATHASYVIVIDVLIALDANEQKSRRIYINTSLLRKMCNRKWHTILINALTMQVIGVIFDKHALISRWIHSNLGNHPGIVSIIMEYAKEYFFQAEDGKTYECGLYRVYAMNHRYIT